MSLFIMVVNIQNFLKRIWKGFALCIAKHYNWNPKELINWFAATNNGTIQEHHLKIVGCTDTHHKI